MSTTSLYMRYETVVHSNAQKLRILLWKDFRLLTVHRKKLYLALTAPALACFMLVALRFAMPIEQMPFRIIGPIDIEDSWDTLLMEIEARRTNISSLKPNFKHNKFVPQPIICYAPTGYSGFDEIVQLASSKLQDVEVLGFANCDQMRAAMIAEDYLAGICFADEMMELPPTDSRHLIDGKYPNRFEYALVFPRELRIYQGTFIGMHWQAELLYDNILSMKDRILKVDETTAVISYVAEGFIALQHAIAIAYIQLVSKNKELPTINMQRLPIPQFAYDAMSDRVQISICLTVLTGYLFTLLHLNKLIVSEKENRLKSLVAYASDWVHSLAWLIVGFIILTVGSLPMVLMLKVHWYDGYGVLTQSSCFALLLYLIAYNVVSMCFCLMVGSFFMTPVSAAVVVSLLWFLTYSPYVMRFHTTIDSPLMKYAMCTISNTALGFALHAILEFESMNLGLQLNNIGSATAHGDTCTIFTYMMYQLAVAVLYFCLGTFHIRLFPRNIRVPLPAIFRADELRRASSRGSTIRDIRRIRMSHVLQIGPDRAVAINIIDLTKKYDGVSVVKNVSLSLYEGEITMLMGHSGSGKTTLISMLVGLVPPTRGHIIIAGYDVAEFGSSTRSGIGIGLTEPALYDDLSVVDQITLFSRTKGMSHAESEVEAEKYLYAMHLQDKRNTLTGELTTGIKKQLAVCCALAGGSKIVILDEPTTGMDLAARKMLWDILLNEKSDRTILMSSHSTEEVEALADRVAILSGGTLMGFGTLMFLKQMFSNGYHLTCHMNEYFSEDELTEVVQKFIPYAMPMSSICNEITYLLENSDFDNIIGLLSYIEDHLEQLGLDTISITETPIEDIFLNLGAEDPSDGDTERHTEIRNGMSVFVEEYDNLLFLEEQERQSGLALHLGRLLAMWSKRCIYNKENIVMWSTPVLLPFAITALTIFAGTAYTDADRISVEFNLKFYQHPAIVVEVRSNLSEFLTDISENYLQDVFWHDSTAHSLDTGGASVPGYFKNEHVSIDKRFYMPLAVTIGSGLITAWFNNQPLHTAPLSLNLVHKAIVHTVLDSNANIEVSFDPLPYDCGPSDRLANSPIDLGNQLSSNISFCMCFIWALNLVYLVKENSCGFKNMQLISGIRYVYFWLFTLLFDVMSIVLSTLMITVVILYIPHRILSEVVVSYSGAIIIAGICMLSVTYIMSLYFVDSTTAFNVFILFNVYMVLCFCAVTEVDYGPDVQNSQGRRTDWSLIAFPQYALISLLIKIYDAESHRLICSDEDIRLMSTILERCEMLPNCCAEPGYHDDKTVTNSVFPEMVCLFSFSTFWWIILLIVEYRRFWTSRLGAIPDDDLNLEMKDHQQRHSDDGIDNLKITEEVIKERVRAMTVPYSEVSKMPLICKHLGKRINGVGMVNRLFLVIEPGEAFGMLGVNGCGKSLILKMLAGVQPMSYGEVCVRGFKTKYEPYEVFSHIGYVPQDDYFLPEFTGYELMMLFGRLYGIPRSKLEPMSENLAKCLGLFPHYWRKLRFYSGGNRKRLSCAIAMLSNPSLLLLDDPSANLDPSSKLQLWNLLFRMRQTGKAIVMATLSMHDCETVCSRMGILSFGRFIRMGTSNQLVKKYLDGYTLRIIIRPSKLGRTNAQSSMRLAAFIETSFHGATLQNECEKFLIFHIPLENVKMAEIFDKLQANTTYLNVERFSIARSTLSLIFIDLAARVQLSTDDSIDIRFRHMSVN